MRAASIVLRVMPMFGTHDTCFEQLVRAHSVLHLEKSCSAALRWLAVEEFLCRNPGLTASLKHRMRAEPGGTALRRAEAVLCAQPPVLCTPAQTAAASLARGEDSSSSTQARAKREMDLRVSAAVAVLD